MATEITSRASVCRTKCATQVHRYLVMKRRSEIPEKAATNIKSPLIEGFVSFPAAKAPQAISREAGEADAAFLVIVIV